MKFLFFLSIPLLILCFLFSHYIFSQRKQLRWLIVLLTFLGGAFLVINITTDPVTWNPVGIVTGFISVVFLFMKIKRNFRDEDEINKNYELLNNYFSSNNDKLSESKKVFFINDEKNNFLKISTQQCIQVIILTIYIYSKFQIMIVYTVIFPFSVFLFCA